MTQGFLNFRDMFDGGGAGKSGQTFQGGPFSGLLNALGVRPMGFNDRQAEAQSRPTGLLGNPPAAPVTAQPMIGNLTTDQILAAINSTQPPRISALPPAAPTAMPTLQELMEMERQLSQMRAVGGFNMAQAFPMGPR